MKKRRLIQLIIFACLALAGLVLFLRWTTPNARINRESFQQIRTGMTEEEVIEILGVPPRKYDDSYVSKRAKKKFDVVGVTDLPGDDPNLITKAWVADGMAIQIGFDQTGKARFVFYYGFEEAFIDRLRRRLQLP